MMALFVSQFFLSLRILLLTICKRIISSDIWCGTLAHSYSRFSNHSSQNILFSNVATAEILINLLSNVNPSDKPIFSVLVGKSSSYTSSTSGYLNQYIIIHQLFMFTGIINW